MKQTEDKQLYQQENNTSARQNNETKKNDNTQNNKHKKTTQSKQSARNSVIHNMKHTNKQRTAHGPETNETDT